MARKARVKSSTGIYHVLVRAISDLSLFTDEEDINIYTEILRDLQSKGLCTIYAYALFPTHVHLLIREGSNDTASCLRCEQDSTIQAEPYDNSHRSELALASRDRQGVPTGCKAQTNRSEVHRSASESSSLSEPIGSVMKRVASSYSYYFNVKYDHYGPIYIDRFKSNPVESRDYFLKVLNHIGSQQTDWKMTANRIPSGLSISSPRGGQEGVPQLLDYRERTKRLTDSKLLDVLISQFHFTNIGEFLQRDEDDQRNIIASCKRLGGSVRQLVRLTGTPFAKVATIR